MAEAIQTMTLKTVPVDTQNYKYEDLQKEYKRLILEEIKRRDKEFYEQWFDDEN